MRIGVDSYSYHRLLGERRRGEPPPAGPPFAHGSLDVLAAVREVGAQVASLETVFLPPPGRLDVPALLDAAGELEIVLAWGHPDGLAWGTDPAALSELGAWIRAAPRLGCTLVRMVAASPRLRWAGTPDEQLEGTARALRRALAEAEAAGVALAIENHGDFAAEGLERLVERCGGAASGGGASGGASGGGAGRGGASGGAAGGAAAGAGPLGICLDTANALRVGDDPVEAARRLAPHVRMLHLKDCAPLDDRDPLAGPESVAYGEGVVDLDGVLRALGPALDDLPVCVELAQLGPDAGDERALVADGVRWLRRWRDAAGATGTCAWRDTAGAVGTGARRGAAGATGSGASADAAGEAAPDR
jgi:sugar phosphate isomerase/epimerase